MINSSIIFAILQTLQPLSIPHYSWAIHGGFINEHPAIVEEYVRITGGASVTVNYGVPVGDLEDLVPMCQRQGGSIGVNFSAYHNRKYRNSDPFADPNQRIAEQEWFRTNLQGVSDYLLGTGVEIGAVLFDSEIFSNKPDNQAWNDKITELHQAMQDIAEEIAPGAYIEWYRRGSNNHNSLDTTANYLSIQMYQVPDREAERNRLRDVVELADLEGYDEITIWLSLCAGYRLDANQGKKIYDFDWRFDVDYAWFIGADINRSGSRYAPYDRVGMVSFFPQPFGSRNPQWVKYFIAYVRGAHNIRGIEDVKDVRDPLIVEVPQPYPVYKYNCRHRGRGRR